MKLENLEKEHLLDIIDLQECLIEGRNLEEVLQTHIEVFHNHTNADILAICLKDEDMVHLKYIIEKNDMFGKLARKYFPLRKRYSWNRFLDHCKARYITENHYMEIKNLSEILEGYISKKEAMDMTEELEMTKGIITPLYTKQRHDKIGFIFFISQTETPLNQEEIKVVTLLMQQVLQPLYDREHYMLYSRCIRINDHMQQLTHQEKKIVKKVLKGLSYPEVASELSISVNTLKTHMKNIYSKYGISSKLELYKKLTVSQ
jgi:DNA-binding CsgD family transcriptional regulator